MPIPTQADYQMSEIDDLHGNVLVRLRTWRHAGPNRDHQSIREALKQYVDKVMAFVNDGEG